MIQDKFGKVNTQFNIDKELNKTTLFMMPSIDIPGVKSNYKVLSQFGFVNCYIDDTSSLYRSSNYIYMLFNPTTEGLFSFQKWYQLYKELPGFVADYMVNDRLIMIVFKVKDKWKDTYQAFKESRYSDMSKEYADMFKSISSSGKVTISYQYLIIHKHADYKLHLEKELDVKIDPSVELMDKLDLSKEIFNYERSITIQSREREREIGETGGSGLYV